MKKTYIIPASRVHKLALREKLMDTSVQGLKTENIVDTNYTGAGDMGGGQNDARTSGSTNIWENEW